jgi:CBS domain-containing protein
MVTGTIGEVLAQKSGELWSVSPHSTVFEAIQTMADKNVGALLVMRDDEIIGVVSERDYTRNVALKGKSSKETMVEDITNKKVISVSPHDLVEQCMRLMTEHRVRHLPVLHNGHVVGIVSIGDLVNWTIRAQSVTITQLEGYISGHYSV